MKRHLNVACVCELKNELNTFRVHSQLNRSKNKAKKTRYTGSITTLRTHIKRMAGEHYEEYRRSCHENNILVNEAAIPDDIKGIGLGTGLGQQGQQPITNYTQVEKATAWNKDTSINLILDFIIETDQVNDFLTDQCHAVPKFLTGSQRHERPIISEDDGVPTWRET